MYYCIYIYSLQCILLYLCLLQCRVLHLCLSRFVKPFIVTYDIPFIVTFTMFHSSLLIVTAYLHVYALGPLQDIIIHWLRLLAN